MRHREKGFSTFEIFLIIIVVSILGLIGWNVYNRQINNPQTVSQSSTTVVTAPKTVVAVGDISCDPNDTNRSKPNYCQDAKVAELVKKLNPDALLLLGDLQYLDGALVKFQNTFSKNWSQFKNIRYPTPGNHEYVTAGAAGYYQYFKNSPIDVSKGYYGFNLGKWNIISLNSNCDDAGGCSTTSTQNKWLEQDLSISKASCTLAFWHHPRFTSGEYRNNDDSKNRSINFWNVLTADKADIVLNGHDHLYERYAKQLGTGQQSVSGIRQFVVGTGGKSLYNQSGTTTNSEKVIDGQFGVLKLDLYENSYKWQFININNQILDQGTGQCNS